MQLPARLAIDQQHFRPVVGDADGRGQPIVVEARLLDVRLHRLDACHQRLRAGLVHQDREAFAVEPVLAVMLDRLLAQLLLILAFPIQFDDVLTRRKPGDLETHVDHRLDVLEDRVVRRSHRHDGGIGRRLPRPQRDGVNGHLALAQFACLGPGRQATIVLTVGEQHDPQHLALSGACSLQRSNQRRPQIGEQLASRNTLLPRFRRLARESLAEQLFKLIGL